MNWLQIAGALLRLATSLWDWLRERTLLAAGEAKGRAASDAEHARAAAEQGVRMREIADNPPSRTEVEKRLEEGSA